MSNNALTGSEVDRLLQIQNQWLTFEPISDERYSLNSHLYTVPLGQTFESEVIINSGSVSSFTGAIDIEKDIHLFDDENEAVEFITTLGPENITSYTEAEVQDEILGTIKLFEVHVVNNPEIQFQFEIRNGSNEKGFVVEPFISGSSLDSERVDLEPVSKEIILDEEGEILSDTYLRYFCFFCGDAGSNVENTSIPDDPELAEPEFEEDEGVL